MRISLAPEAVAELIAATDWYDEQRAGLGERFVAAIGATLDRISERPLAGPIFVNVEGLDIRRRRASGFPYFIVYGVVERSLESHRGGARSQAAGLLARSRALTSPTLPTRRDRLCAPPRHRGGNRAAR